MFVKDCLNLKYDPDHRGLENRLKIKIPKPISKPIESNQFKLHFQIALVRFSWTANSEYTQDDAKIVKEPETVPVETKIVKEPETVPVGTKIVKEPESLSRDNFMPPKKFRAKMLIPTWFL